MLYSKVTSRHCPQKRHFRPRCNHAPVDFSAGEADLTYRLPALSGEFAAIGDSLNRFIGNLHGIMESVSSATSAVASACHQISDGNQDLSSRTESQASSLKETAASMEELIGTVRQNAGNAVEANRLTESASEVAIRGGNVVAQVSKPWARSTPHRKKSSTSSA